MINDLDRFIQSIAIYVLIIIWSFLSGVIIANNYILKDKKDRICPNVLFAIILLILTIIEMFRILPVSF